MKNKPFYLAVIVFTLYIGIVLLWGQTGTGPGGAKVYDHRNDIVVMPNTNPSPGLSVPPGSIAVYGDALYFKTSDGRWSKVTAATPTVTPTPTP